MTSSPQREHLLGTRNRPSLRSPGRSHLSAPQSRRRCSPSASPCAFRLVVSMRLSAVGERCVTGGGGISADAAGFLRLALWIFAASDLQNRQPVSSMSSSGEAFGCLGHRYSSQ